jgi:hypothetical protein
LRVLRFTALQTESKWIHRDEDSYAKSQLPPTLACDQPDDFIKQSDNRAAELGEGCSSNFKTEVHMKRTTYQKLSSLLSVIAIALLSVGSAKAQTANTYGGGYSTGYGTVYGSFGQAMATQNIYNSMQMQMQKTMMRNAMIKKWGLAAVEKAEREAGTATSPRIKNATPSNAKILVPAPPVVRNYGLYRPDPTIDTGKAFADALGETPQEKALIKQIYTATKNAYEKEVASKGWGNNIAGGLIFFTVTAMTIYHDAEEPGDAAVNDYYKVVNAALDDIPAFATVSNKDKQNFNNMLIGFGGLLIAGYTEGKQNNDPETIRTYQQLAGKLIQLVLKTDPDNLRLANGQIVMK